MLNLASLFFGRFKLSTLMMLLSLLVITAMLLSTLSSTSSVREGVINIERQTLKYHVTSIAKLIAHQPQDITSLRQLLYPARWYQDDSGYVFLVNGKDASYIVYPPKPEKEGKALSNIVLDEGGTLAQAIIQASQTGQPAMVNYPHKKPGDDDTTQKAAYLYPLERGGNVLVSGVYLDSSKGILAAIYKQIFVPFLGVAVFVIITVFIVTKHLNLRVNYLISAMQKLAQGDLRDHVDLKGRDEMSFIAKALNLSQKKLSETLLQQTQNGANVATTAVQMDTNLGHTNKLIQSQLNKLDQLASAMEEMVCSISEVAENAMQASVDSHSVDDKSHQGAASLAHCIKAINQVSEQLQQCSMSVQGVSDGVISIHSVVDTINSISEQTNLLALNAAIESARAGEHGRGFAVVADEVRQLAFRTQGATSEIADMIEQLKQQAQETVSLVENSVLTAETGLREANKVGSEFSAITEEIGKLNDRNTLIAAAAEQQATVAQTMSQSVNDLHLELGQTNSELMELAAGSLSLKEQAEDLDQQLAQFQCRDYGQQPG
ncbi:methyl-accepting chemotaxis protein [Motilimonas cestriensis]|uniref:Methyl-accepting chemotaxis protein n=1 Tax=Motilimonas cestriensis TaxID=2742685 RepID=A0ABS8WET7_9GAMM|nr:methyl-accepting chemotaxis protein [Motilimonas cestriensis]MCE2596256.1 methyl-accepting chemotaxis protein [Motilimonas cestriensis]